MGQIFIWVCAIAGAGQCANLSVPRRNSRSGSAFSRASNISASVPCVTREPASDADSARTRSCRARLARYTCSLSCVIALRPEFVCCREI